MNRPETYYPLKAKACAQCRPLQTQDHAQAGAAKLELTRAFLRRKEEEHRVAKEEIRRLRKELSETAGKTT